MKHIQKLFSRKLQFFSSVSHFDSFIAYVLILLKHYKNLQSLFRLILFFIKPKNLKNYFKIDMCRFLLTHQWTVFTLLLVNIEFSCYLNVYFNYDQLNMILILVLLIPKISIYFSGSWILVKIPFSCGTIISFSKHKNLINILLPQVP